VIPAIYSADSENREHPLIWLQKHEPFIHEIVDFQPEETNGESEPTDTDNRLPPSLQDLDFDPSFDPE
jgi:hypothetical protein